MIILFMYFGSHGTVHFKGIGLRLGIGTILDI